MRDRQTDRQRQAGRQTERQTDRDRNTQRVRDRQRRRDRDRESERQTDRDRQTQTDRHRNRQTERLAICDKKVDPCSLFQSKREIIWLQFHADFVSGKCDLNGLFFSFIIRGEEVRLHRRWSIVCKSVSYG